MSNSPQLSFPVKPFKTHGGANVPHRKNTKDVQSVVMPAPKQVIISMSQHLGAPCKPLVKVGEEVKVGQCIGDSEQFMSAPIHSSVSGKVSKMIQITMPMGNKVDAVVIDSDGLMTVSDEIAPPVVNSKEDLVNAIKTSGLVGLGGAGFPASIKINVPKDKKIDTLLINGAECEPYITSDYREAMENSNDILNGVYKIKELLGIDRVIIAIESNKPDAIKVLTKIAEDSELDPENHVRVLKLDARYPQGAEKVLVQACTGRVVPEGKLPADVGCIVMNITSVGFLARYLATGMPLVSKRLTVDGSAIAEPKNVIVPIGTPISDLIEFCGGYKKEATKLITGGPMMGFALVDDTLPILKQNNAILALTTDDITISKATDCIRCGKCVSACPMNLMPTMLDKASELSNVELLKDYNVMNCMECGSCAFVCPAHRHLVQAIRKGKGVLRSASAK